MLNLLAIEMDQSKKLQDLASLNLPLSELQIKEQNASHFSFTHFRKHKQAYVFFHFAKACSLIHPWSRGDLNSRPNKGQKCFLHA